MERTDDSHNPPTREDFIYGLPPPHEPEATAPPSPQGKAQSFHDYATELLGEGWSPSQVEEELLRQGLNGNNARAVMNEVAARAPRRRRAGGSSHGGADGRLSAPEAKALLEIDRRNMLLGGVICVGGTLITVVSFMAASGPAGGPFILAWGAIVFGAVQFFRGVAQSQAATRD